MKLNHTEDFNGRQIRLFQIYDLFYLRRTGFIGGFFAVKPTRRNGIVIGALSAVPAFMLIFLVTSIISHTGISATGWIAAAITVIFSAVGGIICANKR